MARQEPTSFESIVNEIANLTDLGDAPRVDALIKSWGGETEQVNKLEAMLFNRTNKLEALQRK